MALTGLHYPQLDVPHPPSAVTCLTLRLAELHSARTAPPAMGADAPPPRQLAVRRRLLEFGLLPLNRRATRGGRRWRQSGFGQAPPGRDAEDDADREPLCFQSEEN